MPKRKDETYAEHYARKKVWFESNRQKNVENRRRVQKKYYINHLESVRSKNRIHSRNYRKNHTQKTGDYNKNYYRVSRDFILNSLGFKCDLCPSTLNLNIVGKHGTSLRRLKPQFNNAAATAYRYYYNNPNLIHLDLHLLCNKHQKLHVIGTKYNLSEEQRRNRVEKRSHRVLPSKDTQIELSLQNRLKQEGIEIDRHKLFKIRNSYHRVDIFIEPNLCIEADGEFWHTRIIHSKGGIPLKRDYIIDYELERQGCKVIRFPGNDIKNNLDWCILLIKSHMRTMDLCRQ